MTNKEYAIYGRNGAVLFFPRNYDEKYAYDTEDPALYEQNADQLFPLGTILKDGRDEWIYCLNGSSGLTVLGTPIQQAARQHAEADDDIVVGAASAIGAKTVTLTSTANLAVAANYYRDGPLYVNDAAGQGQTRQIKSHPALAGTADTVFTLYDALTVALTTSSQVGLRKHMCDSVIATAAVCTGSLVGVNPIAVTASYYFWAKRRGIHAVTAHAAVALGTWVVVGTTAAKADPSAALTTEQILGLPVTPGVADTEQFLVDLMIP